VLECFRNSSAIGMRVKAIHDCAAIPRNPKRNALEIDRDLVVSIIAVALRVERTCA
jgi:hypothetical protein